MVVVVHESWKNTTLIHKLLFHLPKEHGCVVEYFAVGSVLPVLQALHASPGVDPFVDCHIGATSFRSHVVGAQEGLASVGKDGDHVFNNADGSTEFLSYDSEKVG